MAASSLTWQTICSDAVKQQLVAAAKLKDNEAEALVPYPCIGRIEALTEGKVRVVFLNLVALPPNREGSGPFPSSACKNFVMKKCAGRGRQIYQPGRELGELLVQGVEAGLVVILQVTPFGVDATSPIQTSVYNKLKAFAYRCGQENKQMPGHQLLLQELHACITQCDVSNNSYSAGTAAARGEILVIPLAGRPYWQPKLLAQLQAAGHVTVIEQISNRHQGVMLMPSDFRLQDLQRLKQVLQAGLADASRPAAAAPTTTTPPPPTPAAAAAAAAVRSTAAKGNVAAAAAVPSTAAQNTVAAATAAVASTAAGSTVAAAATPPTSTVPNAHPPRGLPRLVVASGSIGKKRATRLEASTAATAQLQPRSTMIAGGVGIITAAGPSGQPAKVAKVLDQSVLEKHQPAMVAVSVPQQQQQQQQIISSQQQQQQQQQIISSQQQQQQTSLEKIDHQLLLNQQKQLQLQLQLARIEQRLLEQRRAALLDQQQVKLSQQERQNAEGGQNEMAECSD